MLINYTIKMMMMTMDYSLFFFFFFLKLESSPNMKILQKLTRVNDVNSNLYT